MKFRYPPLANAPFYILVLAYAYLIGSMTYGLWFGDGVNIFASYSDATDPAQFMLDANKVYWSKTCFLFGSLFLTSLNVDYRAAIGVSASFWAASLIVMFGSTMVLLTTLTLGLLTLGLQVWRGHVFSSPTQ